MAVSRLLDHADHRTDAARLDVELLETGQVNRCHIVVTHEIDLVACEGSSEKEFRHARQSGPHGKRHRDQPDACIELPGDLPHQFLIGIDLRAAEFEDGGTSRVIAVAAAAAFTCTRSNV
jgi:hypothetical protein